MSIRAEDQILIDKISQKIEWFEGEPKLIVVDESTHFKLLNLCDDDNKIHGIEIAKFTRRHSAERIEVY